MWNNASFFISISWITGSVRSDHSRTDPMILYMTIRESKKLVPFSLFLLKCRCTGRFKTGVVAPTTPVLLPVSFWTTPLFVWDERWVKKREEYGRCSVNTSRALRPLFIGAWATWREKGRCFFDLLKNFYEISYRLKGFQLPTDPCFITDWSPLSYWLRALIDPIKALICLRYS